MPTLRVGFQPLNRTLPSITDPARRFSVAITAVGVREDRKTLSDNRRAVCYCRVVTANNQNAIDGAVDRGVVGVFDFGPVAVKESDGIITFNHRSMGIGNVYVIAGSQINTAQTALDQSAPGIGDAGVLAEIDNKTIAAAFYDCVIGIGDADVVAESDLNATRASLKPAMIDNCGMIAAQLDRIAVGFR